MMDPVRYLDAWNRHAIDDVLTFFEANATYTDVALGQSHAGNEAMREFFTSLERDFSSDYRFDVGPSVVTEHGYAVEWVMRGTHDGTGPLMPATGKPYIIHGVSVGELKDGKIARNSDYWNMVEFLMQVGMMPQPAAAHA
ncbi:MAG: nuclear transport factor 2 family protein [Chloroflexi bacterium]|nr:nuclear transport factor 2 family protein [Chloroflexota bacterium]